MTTLSGAVLASALLLSFSANASAQLRRIELGAAADYLGWSSMVPSAVGEGRDDRIAFGTHWALGGTLSAWLGRWVALRANATYAKSSLVHSEDPFHEPQPREVFLDRDVRLLSASGELVFRPLGPRSRRLLFLLPVVPYVAIGAGATWIDPLFGQSCDESAGQLCGTVFTSDTGAYVLDRRTVPTGLVAFGLDVPMHRFLGLRAELGNRVMRSPLSHVSFDSNGDPVRGERVDRVVHGPYARLGVRLFPGTDRTATRPPPDPVQPVTPVVPIGVPADAPPQPSAPLEAKPLTPDPTARPVAPVLTRNEPAGEESVITLLDIGARVDTIPPEVVWTTSAGAVAGGAEATAAAATNGSNGHYDVVLDVPNVSVDEITLEVNNIHAHVSLDAKVAKLVSLNVGADAAIDRVFLGIRGVQAEAYLKVDLDNVTKIVDRVLTTIDRNPEIISGLLQTLETTVTTVGSVANTALQPGGVVSQVVETVGDVANTALQPGGVVSQVVETVGDVANTALQPGGVVSQVVETVGDVATTTLQPGGVASQLVGAVGGTLQNLTAEGGLLSAQGINALGQTISRTVDGTGRILERTLDQTGTLIGEQVLGNVLQLPILGQGMTATGQIVRTVQDLTGAIIEVTLDAANNVLGTRVLQQGLPLGLTQAAAPAANVISVSGPPAPAPTPNWGLIDEVQEPQGTQAQGTQAQGTQLLLVAIGVQPDGNIIQRVVDPAGTLVERVINPISGQVLSKTPIGEVLRLGLVRQAVDSAGNMLRVVQDVSGGLVELTLNQGILTRMRVVKLGSAIVSGLVPNEPPSRSPVPVATNSGVPVATNSGVPVATNAGVPVATNSGVPVAMSSGVPVITSSPGPVATNSPVGTLIAPLPDDDIEKAAPAAVDSVPTLLLGQFLNERGRLVQRFVDVKGNITERYLNAAGQLVVNKRAANARRLPVLREYSTSAGHFVRVVRDELGALLELTFRQDGKLAQVRVLARQPPGAAPAVARTASAARSNGVSPVTPVTPVTPLMSTPTSQQTAGLTAPAAGIIVVIAQTVNAVGQTVQRVVDASGKIVERTLDAAGNTIAQRDAGSLLQLRVMSQIPQGDGRLLLIARDVTGTLLEVVLGTDRRVVSVRRIGA